MSGTVIKIRVSTDVQGAISKAIDRLGGLDRFVKPGDRVLLKPNFNTADAAPASSAFDFVAAAADLAHTLGATVAVGESCTYFLDTRQVMEKWGIRRLQADRPWLEVISFNVGNWVRREVPGGQFLKTVSVPEALDRFDKLIFLPCLKTHKYAAYTGALKLAVGLMKPSERMNLHFRHLQPKIAEINAVIKPALTIMDARRCFINRGPSAGDIREPGLILASTDRAALDIEGVQIIQSYPGNSLAGIEAVELPQIKRALELKIDQ